MTLAPTLGPHLGRWFQTGVSKKKSQRTVLNGDDLDALERMISKKIRRNDIREPVEYGGYGVSIYNDAPDSAFVYHRISAGNKPGYGLSDWKNLVSFHLQPDLSFYGLDNDDNLKHFLKTVICTWEPDWAVVFRSGPPELSARKAGELYLDKMTWVGPARLAEASVLAGDGVTVEEVAGGLLFNRLQVRDDG